MIGQEENWGPADQFDQVSSMENALWGWTESLDIPSALGRMPGGQLGECHALITTIDSSADVNLLKSVRTAIEKLNVEYKPLGGGVVLPGSYLLQLDTDGFFTGFDELWLFREPPHEPKPDSDRLTSDHKLIDAPPRLVTDWLYTNSGIAGLGDGVGLNWITVSPALADLWTA
jgi:hypothetical protein